MSIQLFYFKLLELFIAYIHFVDHVTTLYKGIHAPPKTK
jgi:hypothetical protein